MVKPINTDKLDQIRDYVYNNKPIAGTVARDWLRYLLERNAELEGALLGAAHIANSTQVELHERDKNINRLHDGLQKYKAELDKRYQRAIDDYAHSCNPYDMGLAAAYDIAESLLIEYVGEERK